MSALELRVPPPRVALLCAAAMHGLESLARSWRWALPYSKYVAVTAVALGIVIALLGAVSFRRHQTTVDPLHPEKATTLVTTGIYAYTRNPMYLGLLVVLIGVAVWLGNALAPVMLVIFVLYIARFQIVPEERVLHAKFGEDYAAYIRRVRRWL